MSALGPNYGGERRANRRYRVNFRVRLMREESPEVEGEVTDLSAWGCFVESGEEVREGDLVKLRLDLPGRGDLTIWATSSSMSKTPASASASPPSLRAGHARN
jgi:hypothetical protein